MATARGVVTVTDTTDGLPSINIFQTNENHSFSAPITGVVTDFSSFHNDFTVFVGDTQAAFVTTTPTDNNTYTIGNATVTPTAGVAPVFTLTSVAAAGGAGNINVARMTITAYATSANDVAVTVPITVRRLNNNVTFQATVTFSKSIGGSAETLQVTANRQTFLYTSSESTTASTDDDISFEAVYDGPDSGSFTWTRSVDGGADASVAGTGPSQTLTAADFNTAGAGNTPADVITYTVARSNVVDRISVVRLNSGDASFIVIPRITSGMLNLKNNSGNVVIVTDVFQGANQLSSLSGWTFQWEGPPANDADGARVTLSDSTTGITLENFNSGVDSQITVDASYIENGLGATLNITGSND